jgi:hypothetical protein
MADWLMVVGAIALLASLFLPWSHQLSGAVRAQYGASAALQGVPADPTAWQVYSAVDVMFALLAGALLIAALRGGRAARLALMAALAIAAAFTVHALSVPPTNRATLFDPSLSPPGYTPNPPGAGRGETLALVALGLGLGGLALSLTAD